MFHRSFIARVLIHSPKGIAFTLTTDDAIKNIKDKYGQRWFGANLQYLHLSAPSKEFIPFYLANGVVEATFTGEITYQRTSSANGGDGKVNQSSSTETIYTKLQRLDTEFHENKTQTYGGFKYHIGHMHSMMRHEAVPLLMQKMSLVDTTDATINLFEQSTFGVRGFIEEEVKRQMYALAKERVQSFHPNASSISINFHHFRVKIEELTPVFLPCYVVKASYDDTRYTIYVSGRFGTVGGPYLLNALLIARTSVTTVAALILLLTPNKLTALIASALSSIPVYLLSYYGSKYWPLYKRNRNRRERERQRVQYESLYNKQNADASQPNGSAHFRPNPQSPRQRVQEEYRSSTYWDTHAYEQRWDGGASRQGGGRGESGDRSSSSSSSSGAAEEENPSSFRRSIPRDPKDYYHILGLRGPESINEIRSAYRKIVLQSHPDVGGDDMEMARVNEAYRVLRDPKRRAEYDAL